MTEIDPVRSKDMDGGWVGRGNCGPGCPIETNAWKTDDTLKITHNRDMDQKQKMMLVRLIGIMSSSLILLGLMIRVLGISGTEI